MCQLTRFLSFSVVWADGRGRTTGVATLVWHLVSIGVVTASVDATARQRVRSVRGSGGAGLVRRIPCASRNTVVSWLEWSVGRKRLKCGNGQPCELKGEW